MSGKDGVYIVSLICGNATRIIINKSDGTETFSFSYPPITLKISEIKRLSLATEQEGPL